MARSRPLSFSQLPFPVLFGAFFSLELNVCILRPNQLKKKKQKEKKLPKKNKNKNQEITNLFKQETKIETTL
jgi:hypothetical protein